MAADFRYMKCPRQTWFFVYAIPADLRGHPRFMTSAGKPMDKINESLETKDPDVARDRRDERIVYWKRQFRLLREGPNEDDVREAAVDAYRAALKEKAERAASVGLALPGPSGPFYRDKEMSEWMELCNFEPEDYERKLDDAIGRLALSEIEDYCKRTGAVLEPKTDAYRQFGITIIGPRLRLASPTHGCRCQTAARFAGRTRTCLRLARPLLPNLSPLHYRRPHRQRKAPRPSPMPPRTISSMSCATV